jgi:hypothetical protein
LALLGALLLVLFLLLRPMELWPSIARLHSLELLTAITALGIGGEMLSGQRARWGSPQLGWLAAFGCWAYAVSIARLGLDGGLSAGWAMTLGPIFMVLVMMALRSVERLRAMMLLLLACATFVSAVAIHQGVQPRQCVELHEDLSEPAADREPELIPDGRECEGPRLCESDGAPGSDYVCERVGLFGTYSTQGRVRWRGQLDDPNEVAVIIGVLVPFLFMFGARGAADEARWSGRRVATLLALGVMLALGLWAVVYTQSRGGQLVLATVVVLMFARRFGWWSIVAGGLVTVPIILLSWRSGADADSSSVERAEILSEGLQMLKAHPLVGIGVGQFAEENPMNMAAHNSYLLIATEIGLPGFLIWCGLVWMTIKIPVAIALRPPAGVDQRLVLFAEALAASTIGLHIGVFFLSFVYKHIFFVWLGLAGGLYGAVRQEHPDFEIRTTSRDLAGVFALAVLSIVAVRVVSMTAR